MLLVLSGCGGDDTSEAGPQDGGSNACEGGLPTGNRARVCAYPKLGTLQSPVDLTLSGPVLAAGNTSEQSPCANSPYDPPGFWFEIADSQSEVWVLGAQFQGAGNPLQKGDVVSVRALRGGDGYGPVVASITVRDAGGKLIAYAAEDGSTEALKPPDGISVTRGPPLCTAHDSCGDWTAHDLDVAASGETKHIAYGGMAEVGGYRVTHGGCEQQQGATTCPDWFVAHVALGIVPVSK